MGDVVLAEVRSLHPSSSALEQPGNGEWMSTKKEIHTKEIKSIVWQYKRTVYLTQLVRNYSELN